MAHFTGWGSFAEVREAQWRSFSNAFTPIMAHKSHGFCPTSILSTPMLLSWSTDLTTSKPSSKCSIVSLESLLMTHMSFFPLELCLSRVIAKIPNSSIFIPNLAQLLDQRNCFVSNTSKEFLSVSFWTNILQTQLSPLQCFDSGTLIVSKLQRAPKFR